MDNKDKDNNLYRWLIAGGVVALVWLFFKQGPNIMEWLCCAALVWFVYTAVQIKESLRRVAAEAAERAEDSDKAAKELRAQLDTARADAAKAAKAATAKTAPQPLPPLYAAFITSAGATTVPDYELSEQPDGKCVVINRIAGENTATYTLCEDAKPWFLDDLAQLRLYAADFNVPSQPRRIDVLTPGQLTAQGRGYVVKKKMTVRVS